MHSTAATRLLGRANAMRPKRAMQKRSEHRAMPLTLEPAARVECELRALAPYERARRVASEC
jgi:hypothetical protein